MNIHVFDPAIARWREVQGTAGLLFNGNYIWDTASVTWIKWTGVITGISVGVDVSDRANRVLGVITVADGGDTAEGAKADVAYVSGSGSVISILKGLFSKGDATEVTLARVPGLSIPIHDYVSLAQNSTQDIWTFKTGGAGGSTVATVTITYTDTTKVTISTVVKT